MYIQFHQDHQIELSILIFLIIIAHHIFNTYLYQYFVLGPATLAELGQPRGLYVDILNNIYVSDTTQHAVRIIKVEDNTIDSVLGLLGNAGASTGDVLQQATSAFINTPTALYVNNVEGSMYTCDTNNNVIRKVLYFLPPTGAPSFQPTANPTTRLPTEAPTTRRPTRQPTDIPTSSPTDPTLSPTQQPTRLPIAEGVLNLNSSASSSRSSKLILDSTTTTALISVFAIIGGVALGAVLLAFVCYKKVKRDRLYEARHLNLEAEDQDDEYHRLQRIRQLKREYRESRRSGGRLSALAEDELSMLPYSDRDQRSVYRGTVIGNR